MNGAGFPYVVDAVHDAAVAVMVKPHRDSVVNGAPLVCSSSKPTREHNVVPPAGGIPAAAANASSVGECGAVAGRSHA
jgi:hypothetical protein